MIKNNIHQYIKIKLNCLLTIFTNCLTVYYIYLIIHSIVEYDY